MITLTTGDLFEAPVQTLVNPVNTAGVMGKGLAKAFAARFPQMVEPYLNDLPIEVLVFEPR